MSIAVNTIPAPYIHSTQRRRKNTWYSIASGNWNDPNVWQSNALAYGRGKWNYPALDQLNAAGSAFIVPIFPQIGDDIYINLGHSVTLNLTGLTINNLYVAGSFSISAGVISFFVNGDLQVTGSVTLTATATLTLRGVNNFINTFTASSGTVSYARLGDQYIMDLAYAVLLTTGSGRRFIPSVGLTTTGAFTSNVPLYALGSGNILTGGLFTINQTIDFAVNPFDSSATNPNVELRGGLNFAGFISTTLGSGTWTFTTTTPQTLLVNSGSGVAVMFNAMVVSGAITVNNTSTGIAQVNTLDGTVAGSTFNNKGKLFLNSTTLPMVTAGVFDNTTFTPNTLGYVFNGSYTLPYTTYNNLEVRGTGTKTTGGNTTCGATLAITNSGTLQLSTFDLTVTTTTVIGTSSSLLKSGAGNVIFIGLFTLQTASSSLDFSGGNPTVEFRGGAALAGTTFASGSGIWTFSTNNQNISGGTGAVGMTVDAPILISGAITLTLLATFVQTWNGVLDGNNASSKFDNRGTINYKHATQPMATGLLEVNAAANTWKYNKAGNQDVRGGITYRTLEYGTSGVKTLQGNIVVATAFSITGTATENLNGFTRT